MKKQLALVLSTLILISCKKEFTCECNQQQTSTTNGVLKIEYQKSYSTYKERTREKAQSACDGKSKTSVKDTACTIIN